MGSKICYKNTRTHVKLLSNCIYSTVQTNVERAGGGRRSDTRLNKYELTDISTYCILRLETTLYVQKISWRSHSDTGVVN